MTLVEGLLERGAEAPRPAGLVRRRARLGWLALLAVALGWSLWGAGVGRREILNPQGFASVGQFVAGAVHPDVAASYLHAIISGTFVTLSYATLGAALSVVVGLVGALAVSQTFWQGERGRGRRAGWIGARALLALPRGLHEAIWGLLLVNILGSDPLVGVLAIGIPYGAITAKVYADLLDETPRGPYLACRASGAGPAKACAYGLLPQTFADMVSYGFYRFDCSIRAAVILGIIGAGGLGFQLDEAFQALDYHQMWTAIYALVVVCGIGDLVSRALRHRLGASRPWSCTRPAKNAGRSPEAAPQRDRWLVAAALAGVACAGAAWWYLGLDPAHLVSAKTRHETAYVLSQAWPPQGGRSFVAGLWRATVATFQMSILAMVLSTAAAIAVAPLAARAGAGRTPPVRAASALCRLLLLLARAIPAPVWAFVILFAFLPGPLPGALALAAYNFGVLGRLMGEVVENLPVEPHQSLLAQGAGRVAAFAYGVAPRAAGRFLAYGLYRWEVAVRETIVVGLVGAGGLGILLEEQVAGFDWHGVFSTLVALVALTLAVDLLSAAARRVLR